MLQKQNTKKATFLPSLSIYCLILSTIGLLLIDPGKTLNLTYPTLCFSVGLILYFRHPILYINFTLWIWFLTPLVRRVADYRSSFVEPSPILLAPFVTSLISGITFVSALKYIKKEPVTVSFSLCVASTVYCFLFGLIKNDSASAAISFLDWITPILFGFYVYSLWKHSLNRVRLIRSLTKTFLWAALIMGVYGVIQFLILPPWDAQWLEMSELTSAGRPFPFEVRVWSTLNSPGPYAACMAVALIVLLNRRDPFSVISYSLAFLGFLLSLNRGGWIGWFAGIFFLLCTSDQKQKFRISLLLLVISALVVVMASSEPFYGIIQERISSLIDLSSDYSVNTRAEAFDIFLDNQVYNFLGIGMKNQYNDSSIIDLLLYYGWLGATAYLLGLLLLIARIFSFHNKCLHPRFLDIAKAVVFCCLSQIPIRTALVGVQGVMLWLFIGIALAMLKSKHHSGSMLVE